MRRKLTSLKLSAIAAVDNPCQEGARAVLLKRAPDPVDPSAPAILVAKYYGDSDEAQTFDELLAEREFDEATWPMVGALSDSIRSIMRDKDLNQAAREAKITTSVEEFLSALRDKTPASMAKIEALIVKTFTKEPAMKTVEQLTADIAEMTKTHTAAIEALTAEKGTLETRATTAEGEVTTLKARVVELEKAAPDETIKIGETVVSKAAVGDTQFAVFKAQQASLDAAREETLVAKLEKRAEVEFAHVPGTPAEKALVLRALEGLAEPVQKSATAIIEAAEKLAKAGFDRLGRTEEQQVNTQKAQTDFDAKVTEIEKRDSIPRHQAMQKAREEAPALFEAIQEGSGAAAAN